MSLPSLLDCIEEQTPQSQMNRIEPNKHGMKSNPYKDLSPWGLSVYQCVNIHDAINGGLTSDGIYQISLGGDCVLDVLVQNMEFVNSANCVLIGLNGAVTQREIKKGPFFSGTSITKNIGVPSISISDPTLDLDGKVGLAWYAGNEIVPDLPKQIATIINGFASKHHLKPILFGGSGAGFAALNISPHLNVPHLAVVWNPQTRIVKYFARFVEKYLKSGFPKLWAKMYNKSAYTSSSSDREAFLSSVLNSSGTSHSLDASCLNRQGQVVFLQNRDDWHVEVHADPFLKALGPWQRAGPASFIDKHKSVGAVFGSWGDGHVPPPRKVVYAALEFCVKNPDVFAGKSLGIFSLFAQEPFFNWTLCLDEPKFEVAASSAQKSADQQTLRLEVAYSDSTSTVLAELSIYPKNDKADEGSYAFYLLVNGSIDQVRWYEGKPSVEFKLDTALASDSDIEILAFLRYKEGKTKRIRKFVYRK